MFADECVGHERSHRSWSFGEDVRSDQLQGVWWEACEASCVVWTVAAQRLRHRSGWLDNTSRCSPSCVACSSVRDKTRHVRCQTRTRSRRSDKCGSNHCHVPPHVASEFQKLCTWRAHEHDEGAGSWVGGHERVSRRGRLCHLTTCCLYSITLFYLMWR